MPMRRSIRSLIVVALVGTLSLFAVPAAAQDESPAPDPAAALAGSSFAGIFPTELGGRPWGTFEMQTGPEFIEDLDEEELAQIEDLLETVDATADDMTVVIASQVSEDFSEGTFLIAFQVAGVEPDLLLETVVPLIANDIEEPRQEDRQIGGKDVVLISDVSSPDGPALYAYAGGDIAWIVASTAESGAAGLLDLLP